MNYKTINIPYPPVNIGTDSTAVVFYKNINSALVELSSKAKPCANESRRVYVVDTIVAELEPVKKLLASIDTSIDSIVVLKPGETHKTIESILQIITVALDADMQRSSIFTGIGGGVICDMTAFAASIFKRGAQLELVPTTLLAMVDAAIGGKTGCDFDSYKNMIGSFYPASVIHIASEFVQSQSKVEFLSGLAEVAKTAILYDTTLFKIMQEEKTAILQRKRELMLQIINSCARAKAHVVEKDLMEKNIRMQLNLGHTFGHALESLAGLGTITHGDAVAWGIGRAIQLSLDLGHCTESYRDEVFALLNEYGWCTKKIHPVLQNQASDTVASALLASMKKDKKNGSKKIRVIMQSNINATIIEEVADKDILAVLTSKI